MVESNTRPFLQNKVLSEPAALMTKGLVARKVKTQRARGSGRADNPTFPASEVTETLLCKTLMVTTALRWPSATKIPWEATVVCFQKQPQAQSSKPEVP